MDEGIKAQAGEAPPSVSGVLSPYGGLARMSSECAPSARTARSSSTSLTMETHEVAESNVLAASCGSNRASQALDSSLPDGTVRSKRGRWRRGFPNPWRRKGDSTKNNRSVEQPQTAADAALSTGAQLASAAGVRWPFSLGRRSWMTTSGRPTVDTAEMSGIEVRGGRSGPSSEQQAAGEAQLAERLCPVCFEVKAIGEFPNVTSCEHRTCHACLVTYFGQEIQESRTQLACPECNELYTPQVVTDILATIGDAEVQKYLDFTLRRNLATAADMRWCPAPDCGYGVIAANCASCPRISCERPGCNTAFCYHCKQEWHPTLTCDEAERRRMTEDPTSVLGLRQERSRRSGNRRLRRGTSDGEQLMLKPCPKCRTKIMKANDGSCNHITCSVCECHFCWLCLRVIDDLHFISPTGCTFWGKRTWSRKKTILAQLALLFGAPIGMALLTLLTPPIVMVALPAYWVDLAAKRTYSSKLKRYLILFLCLVGGVLVAPILAVLGLAIFLPIMCFFCYAVLPCQLVLKLIPCLEDEPDPDRFGVPYDADDAVAAGSVRREVSSESTVSASASPPPHPLV